jgi:Kef-type K+ transport system membrane component KefB
MIFESGLHFDFDQARTVGPWACAVAVLGTFLPLLSGTALSMAYGFDFLDSLAAGTALAPTSVGIALTLLHQAKALHLYFGQAVMTAAFVDDVLSLILFSVIFNLGDDMKFTDFIPLLSGCVFMVVAIIAAVKVWPVVIKKLFEMIPETKPHHRVTRHDEVLWLLMFGTLLAYATITDLCGTHLWGCFIAGMSFATQPHATHVWVRQVKRITCWWLRLFFGCTLAWAIPVNELFSLEAFWKGTLMGIGPCIASKVLCAPFMGKSRWVIGWAMVGRAEFAYFIAILASISPSSSCNPDKVTMMDKKLFAILVWALLYATVFAPLVFRSVLQRYMHQINPGGSVHIDTSLSVRLPDVEAEEEEHKNIELLEKLARLENELEEKKMEIEDLRTPKVSTSSNCIGDIDVFAESSLAEIVVRTPHTPPLTPRSNATHTKSCDDATEDVLVGA